MAGARLFVREAALDLRLGWTEEERSRPQRVLIDLEIVFPEEPEACRSDELSDTVCYGTMIAEIRNRVGESRLIESLAARIHGVVAGLLPRESSLAVTVHKISLPLSDVKEASFTYSAVTKGAVAAA